MILKIGVIVLVLAMAYAWAMRGFFSALLHMIAVVIAGAIAFAAWEPVSMAVLGVAPTGFLGGSAWGIGLLVPFAVSTILIRVLMDKAVPGNASAGSAGNFVGGAACGLAASIIVVGVLVIGLGSMRFSAGFFGYRPMWYNEDNRTLSAGSLKVSDSLWLPVDKITGALYSHLSENSFSSSEPLAKWYPDVHAAAFSPRIAPDDFTPRASYTTDDFSIIRRYTVGDPDGGTPVRDLLRFQQGGETVSQPYADTAGEQVSSGHLEGFVIKLEASAKDAGERGGGQVVFSNGQARLVCEDSSGNTFNVFPVAMVSQASSDQNVYGRWRYAATGDFFASVGGASTATIALEFVVPAGTEPIGLFIKGARVLIDAMPSPTAYPSVSARNALIPDGGLLRGEEAQLTLDTSRATIADGSDPRSSGVVAANQLGGRMVLHVQTARVGFDLDDNNRITDGYNELPNNLASPPQDRNLRVDRFSVGSDQAIVQVQMGDGTPASLLVPPASQINADEPMRLYDTNGLAYDAVGYIYKDRSGTRIQYKPTAPLTGTQDVPQLSSSRTDQELTVIFMASFGVSIEHLAIGDTVILTFDPPLVLNTRQQ